MIWVFKRIIFRNYHLDFLNQGFNRQLTIWGWLFNRKNHFVPSVGILILRKIQKVPIMLTYLDIQIHLSSSTLPAKVSSTTSYLKKNLQKNHQCCSLNPNPERSQMPNDLIAITNLGLQILDSPKLPA